MSEEKKPMDAIKENKDLKTLNKSYNAVESLMIKQNDSLVKYLEKLEDEQKKLKKEQPTLLKKMVVGLNVALLIAIALASAYAIYNTHNIKTGINTLAANQATIYNAVK